MPWGVQKDYSRKFLYAIVSSKPCYTVISTNLWKCKWFIFRKYRRSSAFWKKHEQTSWQPSYCAYSADTCHIWNKKEERQISLHSDLAVWLHALQNIVKDRKVTKSNVSVTSCIYTGSRNQELQLKLQHQLILKDFVKRQGYLCICGPS